MKLELKLQGLDGVLESLKMLPPELVSKRGGPVRSALRKGAVLIQKQAKANFDAAVNSPGKSGLNQSTGFTERQIVVRRRNPGPNINGERMVVTVQPKKHPSGRKYRKGVIQANDIAFIMEMGSRTQPATPWLRPAFIARAEEAIRLTEDELFRQVDRIWLKLIRTNKAL